MKLPSFIEGELVHHGMLVVSVFHVVALGSLFQGSSFQ